MSTLSPNMSLVLPVIGIDSGLTWEQAFNTNGGILDGHNHSVGSGIQINPSGININADFPFNGFNATTLRSVRFNAQTYPISLPTDIGCVYVSGVDLYYNDVNGNQVQLTSGGTVNATSSGISSGTATASFSSGILVVNSASNTPANIQGASILIGNTGTSGSNFITLSPTGTLSSNYNLNLPALPSQTNVMTLDTSGNMSSITYDQVGSNMTSVGADAIAATRTRASGSPTESTGGVCLTGSSGNFGTTSSTPVSITNFSVTLTTSGRPVFLAIFPDQSGIAFLGGTSDSVIQITRSGGGSFTWLLNDGSSLMPSAVDFPSAGTYSYTGSASAPGGGVAAVQFCKMAVFEL